MNDSYINRKTGLSDDCLFEIDELWIEYYNEKKSNNSPDFKEYKERRLKIIDRHKTHECHKCGTTSFQYLLFCPDCGAEIPSENS